jgi:hypothetical protein
MPKKATRSGVGEAWLAQRGSLWNPRLHMGCRPRLPYNELSRNKLTKPTDGLPSPCCSECGLIYIPPNHS